jgi:hypothetical protein
LKKVLLISLGSVLGLCVLCVGLLYFVALPRAQDAISTQFKESMSTVVSQQLNSSPIAAGQYEITDKELTDSLVNRVSGSSGTNVDSIAALITPSGVQIELKSNTDKSTVNVGVAAQNGKLVVTHIDNPSWLIKQIMPSDKLSKAIEDGVNNSLAAQNLSLTALTLEQGKMTLTTAAK